MRRHPTDGTAVLTGDQQIITLASGEQAVAVLIPSRSPWGAIAGALLSQVVMQFVLWSLFDVVARGAQWWVNLHHILCFTAACLCFVWCSERVRVALQERGAQALWPCGLPESAKLLLSVILLGVLAALISGAPPRPVIPAPPVGLHVLSFFLSAVMPLCVYGAFRETPEFAVLYCRGAKTVADARRSVMGRSFLAILAGAILFWCGPVLHWLLALYAVPGGFGLILFGLAHLLQLVGEASRHASSSEDLRQSATRNYAG